jgi:hypothetical protein
MAAVTRAHGTDAVTIGRALAAAIEDADGEPRVGVTCYLLPANARPQPAPPMSDLDLYALAIHVFADDEPDGEAYGEHVTRTHTAISGVAGVTGIAVLPLGRHDFTVAVGNATLVATPDGTGYPE